MVSRRFIPGDQRAATEHCLPIRVISREVVPYAVEGLLDATGQKLVIFSEHMTGLDFYLDPSMVNVGSAERIRALLQEAIVALEKYGVRPISQTPTT